MNISCILLPKIIVSTVSVHMQQVYFDNRVKFFQRYLRLVEEVEPDDLRLVGRDLDRDRREHGPGSRSGDADRHEHVRFQIHLQWERRKFGSASSAPCPMIFNFLYIRSSFSFIPNISE